MEEDEKTQPSSYQNTFRLIPKKSFDALKAKIHLVNIMELNLKEVEYADQIMKDLCLSISDEVRGAIKADKYDGYRLVVLVTIGEKKMQGVNTMHSFLWDEEKDQYVEHLYETSGFFAQAIIYAIYTD